ncbi:hypothetical protein ES705_27363 [subsurface metagenome]
MRRTTARGRVFPQFYSTDRRYARLSLKATSLYPLMWANADDQGRLCGDPEEIKYTCCPNLDHIAKADVPQLLEELTEQNLIIRYNTKKTAAIQLRDWWDVHFKMQWAWPSDYTPPDGWQDHLRYKKSAKEVCTLNWPVSGETSAGAQVSTPVVSGEQETKGFLPTPKGVRKGNRIRRGRGNSPEYPKGSQVRSPPPSPSDLCTDRNKISSQLLDNFRHWFGTVEAKNPRKVLPREPAAKELAQMRDLSEELIAAGGCPLDYIRQAFREAGGQDTKSKRSVSYVRAILLAWLRVPRAPP